MVSENTKKGKRQNCKPIMCAVGEKWHSGAALYVIYICAIPQCQLPICFSWLSATPSVQLALSYQPAKHNGYIHPSSVTAYPAPRGAMTNPSSLGDKVELSPGQVFGLDMCLLCSKWNHRGTELHALLQVLLRLIHKKAKTGGETEIAEAVDAMRVRLGPNAKI